jgi:hypothetical protein
MSHQSIFVCNKGCTISNSEEKHKYVDASIEVEDVWLKL